MGIKTVPHPSYSSDLAPCGFWLFSKLRGCRYETIEEIKEAVTKVIDTLTQEGFHGAFQKLLERYNKCIAAGGDYFEGDKSFMSVLSIKVPIRKKSGNLFNDPLILNKSWKQHPQKHCCTVIDLLSLKLSKLDKQYMRDTAGEVKRTHKRCFHVDPLTRTSSVARPAKTYLQQICTNTDWI